MAVQGPLLAYKQRPWSSLQISPSGPVQKGQWLGGAELLVTDRQHVLIYDAGLAPLGALSFVDRAVSEARRCRF